MDFIIRMKNINNVDEYISATQEITEASKNIKVQINITTILTLKKIQCHEIEYFIKCNEFGAASILLERLLNLPPSKIWGILAKEIIGLLQYWLEAVRKSLIHRDIHWWNFLKMILKSIEVIRSKDPVMPNMLVELTAECLFDIASRDAPDLHQRQEILHHVNIFSAESSREIRFALRTKFVDYFTKLACHVCTSGYLPVQWSALESLVRWLVPRQDLALRSASAARWFPASRCPHAAMEVFLNKTWGDFYQDAREFLNALNEANGRVTSVLCRRLSVGQDLVISGAEKHSAWLDVNLDGKSVSIMLNTKTLEKLGVMGRRACESLLIDDTDAQTVTLTSDSEEITLTLQTLQQPRVVPTDLPVGDDNIVTAVVSSTAHLRRLDNALKCVFGDKYHLQLDLETEQNVSLPMSNEKKIMMYYSEDDTRFSHPAELKRTKHAGAVTAFRRNKVLVSPSSASTSALPLEDDTRFSHPAEVKRINHAGAVTAFRRNRVLVSPSSTSTSSLALLHERLAALPSNIRVRNKADECGLAYPHPALSNITENTESDESHSVAVKDRVLKAKTRNAKSDTDTFKPKHVIQTHPDIIDEDSSSLLTAALLSADNTLNDNVNLIKNKNFEEDDIVELIVNEALQATPNSQQTKEIVNNQRNEDTEAIENTPNQDNLGKKTLKNRTRGKVCTVISKSTTEDESNTEAIYETPVVLLKKEKMNRKKTNPKTTILASKEPAKPSIEDQTFENFFSQHCAAASTGQLAVSPTLARKINETSSETSEHFDANYIIMNKDLDELEVNDIEIVECLNDILDKVCIDLERCTEYLNKGNSKTAQDANKSVLDSTRTVSKSKTSKRTTKPTKKKISANKSLAVKRKNISSKQEKKMSTIIEQNDEIIEQNSPQKIVEIENISPPRKESGKSGSDTPAMKRKRKLYSPNDDLERTKEPDQEPQDDDDDNVALSVLKPDPMKTPKQKTAATCYKEIQRERNRIRLPRLKKTVGQKEMPSPRVIKMNSMFDKLKETDAGAEKITLVDINNIQANVYNFSSDSEDEDFKKKRIELQKRTSNTTDISSKSAVTLRRSRRKPRPVYSEISTDESKKPSAVIKKPLKRTYGKSKAVKHVEPVIDLVNEKMRDAAREDSNTSIIIDEPKVTKSIKVEPLHKPPQMELLIMSDNEDILETTKNKKTKKVDMLSLKKKGAIKKDKIKIDSNKSEDRTLSPLPGLVIESVPAKKDDLNDSVTAAMVQKFKKVYHEGTDAINLSSHTQNIIFSDNDNNCSAQNLFPTDEICYIDNDKENIVRIKKGKLNNTKTNKPNKTDSRKDLSGNVIQIFDSFAVKSEKSIATIGITGHGDCHEAPPSPEMIRKSMQPREIEDLTESMKEYFVKLNKQLNNSPFKHKPSKSGQSAQANEKSVISTPEKSIVKSPVVSLKRLDLEDITKWLPSRRSSEVSSVKSNTKYPKIEKIFVQPQHQQRPMEMVKKSNKLTLRRKREKEVKKATKNPSIASSVNLVLTEDELLDKWLPLPKSPLQKPNKNSLKLVYKTESQPLKHDIETSNIRNLRSKSKEKNIAQMTVETQSSMSSKHITEIAEQNWTKKRDSSSVQSSSKLNLNSSLVKDLHDSVSSKRKLIKAAMKRKSSEIRNDAKKMKSESNIEVLTVESTSASNVDDWFKRMEPSRTQANDSIFAMNAMMQNIMEKLETTLFEINQNTSKKFVNLFVKVQQQLSDQKEEMRQTYKSVATEIVKRVVEAVDDIMTELESKAQTKNKEFQDQLKQETFQLISKDWKQKQAMVSILKEDVQAVIDHLAKD